VKRRTIAEEVSARIAVFGQEHRGCGGLWGVLWISGAHGFCRTCDAKLTVRFSEVRKYLDEEADNGVQ
jgi:hypothetical protein